MNEEKLSSEETKALMQLLFDAEGDLAAELHDKLTNLGLSRLDDSKPATISVKD